MQTNKTISIFATVSNDAVSRVARNGRDYTAFGIAVISEHDREAFHFNVVAFGNAARFSKSLARGMKIKLAIQAHSQPDNNANIPLLTATFVQPIPAA